ncbi:MAG: oligosaccharide flippase family protein [Clostridia bacterium]|nr:oligosaccharide flippase family protein [Clostridia bacterium]
MKNKRLMFNLFSSVFAFMVQMGINFILAPIIVRKLGNEAYGFIGLANNFVSYATILTVALNSMATRFITIEIHKNNIEKANKYYSSVFFCNIILSLIICIVSIITILNLNSIIQIPDELYIDVKLTFSLIFLSFIISLINTAFSIATFVKNRIDIASVRQIVANVIKMVVLLVLFMYFKPKIYYIGIATIVFSLYILFSNLKITKKILPELKINIKYFNYKKVKTLILSGIWNSINSLGTVLLTGLDLLIANLFIGPYAMGILSISKIMPTAFETLLATFGGVFAPQFTIMYSQNKIEDLVKEIKFSIKLLSLIMIVPISGFIAFGTEFYTLWLPEKSHNEILQIQILSILTIAPYAFSAFIYTLHYLDTITNKLKRPVLCTLIMSIINILIVIIALNVTDLGVYAIAGISSILWILKVVIFNPINAAYNLKIKLTTFYPPLLKAIKCMIIILLLFLIVEKYFIIDSWKDLLFSTGVSGVLGYIISFIMILNKQEKIRIKRIINDKLMKSSIVKEK